MTHRTDLPSITVGDTEEYRFTFTDGDDIAYDLTGWTIYFTVQESSHQDDTDAVISKTITEHDAPAEGKTTVTLTSDDTKIDPGRYVYDVQIKNASGDVRTIMSGFLWFEGEITDRT